MDVILPLFRSQEGKEVHSKFWHPFQCVLFLRKPSDLYISWSSFRGGEEGALQTEAHKAASTQEEWAVSLVRCMLL